MSKTKQTPIQFKPKVPLNLIKANLYACKPIPCNQSKADSTYVELVEITNADGSRIEKLIQKPYDITEEYVKSFEHSSDYRLDPASAVNNGAKRHNLGDVTDMQALYAMDSAEISALSAKLSAVAEFVKAKETKQSTVKENNDNGNESK